MLPLLLIDVLGAAAAVGLWYFLFSRYNQRKGNQALKWVETACLGKGRIVEFQWQGCCRMRVHLSFAAHWFDNARVTIHLLPRPIPVQWLLSLWREQTETVTFEADLDDIPSFHLEIFRHRWLTHNSKKQRQLRPDQNWEISQPGPVVLTTRSAWTQELTPVVNTLMASRNHDLITVRFRPQSPHLLATIPLDSLSDEHTAAGFLSMVRELASGASASRQ